MSHPAVQIFHDDYSKGRMDRREFLSLASAFGCTAAAAYALAGIAMPSAAVAQEPRKGGVLRAIMQVTEVEDPRTFKLLQSANIIPSMAHYPALNVHRTFYLQGAT